MATPSIVGPDSVVTVKVNYNGVTQRAKMVLRDMVPRVLEQQIRSFLHIPADAQTILERYSDSAAAYVRLDPENVSVYKQLYRAAKAKSKLKIRVTVKGHGDKTAPKPVTVEDEADLNPAAAKPVQAKIEIPTETQLPIRPAPASEPRTLPRGLPRVQLGDVDLESQLNSLLLGNMDLNQATPPPRKPTVPASSTPVEKSISVPRAFSNVISKNFAVCCNSCEKTMPGVHFHCSTCEDGDFDLCESCVQRGITCHSNDHWLIKRMTVDGKIVNSQTEKVPPKAKKVQDRPLAEHRSNSNVPQCNQLPAKEAPTCGKVPTPLQDKDVFAMPNKMFHPFVAQWSSGLRGVRTCNACIQELPEREFIHCNTCDDFDLCQACFPLEVMSHHPRHGFVPAVPEARVPDAIKTLMAPGRNTVHHAICDGCDKYVTGIRHKCLDCPDWDYCQECIMNAHFVHPGHRFVPIYERIPEAARVSQASKPTHAGICCDGPLCRPGNGYVSYIQGTRYKCAVCHDVDFCENCEANPALQHNKTHPLIKFKTPVRHVNVTTTGESHDGRRLPAMGDRSVNISSKATETEPTAPVNTISPTATVVNVEPKEPEVASVKAAKVELEVKQEKAEAETVSSKTTSAVDLRAIFVQDTVSDGTIMPPHQAFEQTWTLKNDGDVAWPAGCTVKFVSGDYMGHVDRNHPASVSDLVSASESTVCERALAPGEEFPFTVQLRTPARMGRVISFWRLTAPDGHKFGHRLWCEVCVRDVQPAPEKVGSVPPTPAEQSVDEKEEGLASQESSQMIFPKLEKESPEASVHETAGSTEHVEDVKGTDELSFEDAEWEDSDDGFLTDEEYDILDASDEEYLEQQHNQTVKK